VAALFKSIPREGLGLLAVLFAGVLMGALDIAIVGPALPAIQDAFGVDSRGLSWVFNIYILFGLLSAPLMAKLSDRYGRRSIYLLDIALFALGSLVVAFSPNFQVLLAGRAVQALGAGGILPVASAVIGDSFPPERRGPALGLIGAVFGLAFLLGPLLGGVLLPWSWRWLFLVNLPIAIVIFRQASRLLPSARPVMQLPFDALGTVLLSIALLSLALGVSEIDVAAFGSSLTSPRILSLLVVVAVTAPLFWIAEKRAADPVLHPDLLRSRQLMVVGLIATGTGLAEAGMIFLPALAVASLGVPESTASFMLLPLVSAMIVGAPLAGRLLTRWGAKRIIQSGLLFVVSGLLVFGVFVLSTTTFYLAGALVGIGLSALLGAPLRYIVIREVPEVQRGAGQGLLTLFLSVGRIAGAAAVGGFVASWEEDIAGYQGAYLLVAGMMSLVVMLSVLLKTDCPPKGRTGVPGASPDRRAE